MAPSSKAEHNNYINSSVNNVCYLSVAIIDQTPSATFIITRLLIGGYRGQECEYGGVVISNNNREGQMTYGPFCGKKLYESYSVVGKSIPLKTGVFVIYSYCPYTALSVEYEVNDGFPYDYVISAWDRATYHGYIYGENGRVFYGHRKNFFSPDQKGSRIQLPKAEWLRQKKGYILPENFRNMYQLINRTLLLINTDMDNRVMLLDTDDLHYCDTSIQYMSDIDHIWHNDGSLSSTITITTLCPWLHPIVVVETKELDRKQFINTTKTYPILPDRQLHINIDLTTYYPVISLVTIQHYRNQYNVLEYTYSSCSETYIDIEHFIRYNEPFVIQHTYIISQTMIWLSKHANLPFTIMVINQNQPCAINMTYYPSYYRICYREWFDLTFSCFDFGNAFLHLWSEGPVCVHGHCYRMLTGGWMTWQHAQQKCGSIDAALLTINSYEELHLITFILLKGTTFPQERVYIGLLHSIVSSYLLF